MTNPGHDKPRATRRRFLTATAGLAAVAGSSLAPGAARALDLPQGAGAAAAKTTEPFWGLHQSGIVTPAQTHTYFAAFDLTTAKRQDVENLLRAWTKAAAQLCVGQASRDSRRRTTMSRSPIRPTCSAYRHRASR